MGRIQGFLCLFMLLAGCSSRKNDALHIVFTGDLAGYLEPCGCKEGQVGGVARFAGAVQDSLKQWPDQALIVDAGDFAETYIIGNDPKNRVLLEAFAQVGYHAINITAHDLIVGRQTLRWAADSLKLPLISANLADKTTGRLLFPGWIVKDTGDWRVGVVGVGAIRPLDMLRAREEGLIYNEAETAIKQALAQVQPQCDLVILLCDLNARSTREMAAAIPGIDIIISTMEMPTTQEAHKYGSAYVLGTSRKGTALTTMSLRQMQPDSLSLSFSRALLDETFRDHKTVAGLVEKYHKLKGESDQKALIRP